MFDPARRDAPYCSIMEAIKHLRGAYPDGLQGVSIVEIGSMRQALDHPIDEYDHACCQDGHSTVLFARTGANVFSVDNDAGTVENARKYTEKYPFTYVYEKDGIQFLGDFPPRPIHLLYLDARDVNYEDSPLWHLTAFVTAYHRLATRCFVLIDDTDVYRTADGQVEFDTGNFSGKGAMVIPTAVAMGWKVLFSGRQTLLSRGV